MVRRTKFKIKIQIQIQNNKIFQRRNQKVHLPVDFSCSSPFPFSKSLKLVIPFCAYCKFASLSSIFSLISIFFLLTSDLSLFDSPYVEFAFCFLSPDHVTLSSWVPSFLIKSPGMCHVYCAHLFGLFFWFITLGLNFRLFLFGPPFNLDRVRWANIWPDLCFFFPSILIKKRCSLDLIRWLKYSTDGKHQNLSHDL